MAATISPLYDASGRIVGAWKIAHDITERKREEEEVRQEIRPVIPILMTPGYCNPEDPVTADKMGIRATLSRKSKELLTTLRGFSQGRHKRT